MDAIYPLKWDSNGIPRVKLKPMEDSEFRTPGGHNLHYKSIFHYIKAPAPDPQPPELPRFDLSPY